MYGTGRVVSEEYKEHNQRRVGKVLFSDKFLIRIENLSVKIDDNVEFRFNR